MNQIARAGKLGALIGLLFVQLGCGLILTGRAQSVHVSSRPPGAKVEALSRRGTRHGTAPFEVLVSRRRPQFAVIRASKEGYRSACRIVQVRRDGLLMTLDGIPAAVPLLIDLIAGTLPGDYPNDVEIRLDPLPEGCIDVLPAAPDLLDAFQVARVDFCEPSPELKAWMDVRSRYMKRAAEIVVSVGDLSRSYDIVGRVDVNATGVDYFAWNYWQIGGFGSFQFHRYQHKEDPATMNEMLKFKAFELYGDAFDGILNVHYENMPGNAVSAGGVAVRFRGPTAQPDGPNTEARLQELRRLFDQGLITHDQYERKRVEILNQL